MTPEEKKKIANRLTSEKYELKFNGRPISESALSSENISNAAGQATRSLFSNSAQLQQKRKTGEYPSAAEMKARSRPASANDGGFSGDNADGWVGQGARQVATIKDRGEIHSRDRRRCRKSYPPGSNEGER